MRRNISLGIDIGSGSVRAVVVERDADSPYPIVLGTGSAINNGVRRGYVVSQNDTKDAIKAAIAQATKHIGIDTKRATISLNTASITSHTTSGQTVITRADNEVTQLDIEKAITASENNLPQLTNQKLLNTIPVKFKLDGKDVMGRVLGLTGNKLEVKTLFVSCLEQHVKDTLSVFDELGFDINDAVASPIAGSLSLLSKKQKNTGCVLVDIGCETTSMVAYENGVPIAVHLFPLGGADITNDLALGLKVSLEEAEKIKMGSTETAYSKRKFQDIVEARLTDIFELIDAQLKKIGRSGLLPGGAIIVGGGSKVFGVADTARSVLKIPVTLEAGELALQTKGKLRDQNFGIAYGLAVIGSQNDIDDTVTLRSSAINSVKKLSEFLKQFLP